jgi:dTDP-4-dehydrorhamnose 3,5-epimerase
MNIIKTDIVDALIIEPKIFGDQRGFFMETFSEKRYKEAGIKENFVQDNRSRSSKGVLRGLHFQRKYPQGKLVWATRGEVFDVAVDLRKNSPSYKKWFGVLLSANNNKQFYVPAGCAHGFVVLSDIADFNYKCTDYYHPEDEGSLIWNDAEIGINWNLGDIKPQLSAKDAIAPSFKDLIID